MILGENNQIISDATSTGENNQIISDATSTSDTMKKHFVRITKKLRLKPKETETKSPIIPEILHK